MKLASFISQVETAKYAPNAIIESTYTGPLGANTLSDVHISNSNAERIGAFFTCLRIKAETMASIHTYVQAYDGKTHNRSKDHPADYLLSAKPNRNTNAWNFWYTIQYLEDTWGNAYAEIKRSRGKVVSLHLLPSWEVQVKVVDGQIIYDHKGRIIPSRNILHFKQNSKDGIVGRSLASIQAEQLGLAKKQENYAAKMVGSKPPAVFEGGEGLNAQTAQEAAQSFGQQVTKGLIPIAFGGLKYKNIMLPAGDIQLFEMKGVTTADIYAMFRMPQSKGGNYSREAGATYNNVEQQNINFVQDVVIPATTQKENECNVKLFTREEAKIHEVYFDLSDLLKADLKTQTEHLEKGWSKGWYTANQVREKLNENPITEPHGDRHYVQAGFIPADKVDHFLDSKQTTNTPKINGQILN